MPQSLLTGQLKEKPTYRVWCLYSSFVHGNSICTLQFITAILILLAFSGSSICWIPIFICLNSGPLHLDLENVVSKTRPCLTNIPPPWGISRSSYSQGMFILSFSFKRDWKIMVLSSTPSRSMEVPQNSNVPHGKLTWSVNVQVIQEWGPSK